MAARRNTHGRLADAGEPELRGGTLVNPRHEFIDAGAE
jgi:hypothetical protein